MTASPGQAVAAMRSVMPLVQCITNYVAMNVGAGPVFATAPKPDHKPPIGFDRLARLFSNVSVPVVGIDGPKREHVGYVIAAGAEGMAVVSPIFSTADPRAASHATVQALKEARQ